VITATKWGKKTNLFAGEAGFVAHMTRRARLLLRRGPLTVTNAEKTSPSLPGKE